MLAAAKNAIITTPSSSFRIAPDRRRHKRVELTLLGRFMRASRNEYPCRLVDISVGGAAISSPVAVETGERIVAYFDQLGGLEGEVQRIAEDGFAIEFAATLRRRQKLAEQITWLINQKELSSTELRRPGHNRVRVAKQTIRVCFDDGEVEDCDAIDVSISGASLTSESRPEIGTELTVGKMRARVVHHHEHGFGVGFLDIQRVEAIRKYFG